MYKVTHEVYMSTHRDERIFLGVPHEMLEW